jgi:NADPH:quinone reductase-like Zn-dependent oxidoreductase
MEIRTFAADYPDQIAPDDAEITQLFADGKLRPYIGARFPLDQAAAALRYIADRKAIGKVVIDVS